MKKSILWNIKDKKWISVFIIFLGLYNIISSIIALPFENKSLMIFTRSILIFSEFSALFTGFVLTMLGYGLYKRYRLAWKITLILLLISITFNVLSGINIVGIILSGFLIIVLYINREVFIRRFNIRLEPRYLIAIWIIIFILLYGTTGTYYLGLQFKPPIETVIQALYYTVITATTVGYGDFVPITDNARLFTVSLIIFGVGTFLSAIALIIQPLIRNIEKNLIHTEHQDEQ